MPPRWRVEPPGLCYRLPGSHFLSAMLTLIEIREAGAGYERRTPNSPTTLGRVGEIAALLLRTMYGVPVRLCRYRVLYCYVNMKSSRAPIVNSPVSIPIPIQCSHPPPPLHPHPHARGFQSAPSSQGNALGPPPSSLSSTNGPAAPDQTNMQDDEVGTLHYTCESSLPPRHVYKVPTSTYRVH